MRGSFNRHPWLVAASVLVSLACGSSTAPVEHSSVSSERSQPDQMPESAEPDPVPSELELISDDGGPRRLMVSWSALAEPSSLGAIIVRTDEEWQRLFTGATADSTIDFGSSLVVGLAEASVASVRVDDVREEMGETVVTVTVGLPNPSCGETPPGAVDMVVVDATSLPVRFAVERATTECPE